MAQPVRHRHHLGPTPIFPRRLRTGLGKALCAAGLLAVISPGPAFAADPLPIRLELNRLEARDGLCRVWMVVNNADPAALDPVRLDLVLFGRDGVASRRLAVDIGPLPGGRTVVRLFDVAGQPCDDVGQVLMNDVLACGGTTVAERTACADRVTPVSRVKGVAFDR